MESAQIALWVSIGHRLKARLAESQISPIAVATSQGMPCPPCSGCAIVPFQPPALNCRYASAKPSGVVTTPFLSAQPCTSPPG